MTDLEILNKILEHIIPTLDNMDRKLSGIELKMAEKFDQPDTSTDSIMTTLEASNYLKFNAPALLYHVRKGRIKAKRVGKGYRILKSELDRFVGEGVRT